MIKRWLSIDTVIDNYLDDIGSFEEGVGMVKAIERKVKRAAYNLYSKTSKPLISSDIKGNVKNNMIELPEGFCKFLSLSVNSQPVLVANMQKHLRNVTGSENRYNTSYKADLVGETIMFKVAGGQYDLENKPYLLEYETVPLYDGLLLVPEQFEEAIHAKLRYNMMQIKIEGSGRGQGLLTHYKREKEETEEKAIVDVEFPSWDELMLVGKIYESKVPVSLKSGFNSNFSNI